MRSIFVIFFTFLVLSGYGQAVPSNNSIGLNVFIDASVTDENLKSNIAEFVKIEQIGVINIRKKTSHLSLAFDGTYYTLARLPKSKIVYKIDNSKPSKTLQIIKEKVYQFAYGFKIKNLNLKNASFSFSFRIKPINYEYDEIGEDIPLKNLTKTNGILNFNANSSAAILEVTNLSDNPIYFSIIEINNKGKLSSFIPNTNCALLGNERRLEPHQTISVESCVFQFGPPYETILLKGFASAEPLNFIPIIQNEDNSSLDYVKNYYTEMYTYEFEYNIVDEKGNMPYNVDVSTYEPKSSYELESAISEMASIEAENGKLNSEYINKLKVISTLHQSLGNIEEAQEFRKQSSKFARLSAERSMRQGQTARKSSKLEDNRREAMKNAMLFQKMTDVEKIAFLHKENQEKSEKILSLNKQITVLKNQIDTLSSSRDANSQMRGSVASKSEQDPLSKFTYRAVIIAEQDYTDNRIKDLKFPITDAKQLKYILNKNYAFEDTNITFLENPTRNEIFKTLHSIYEKSAPTDHLLIFYAGHGVYDEGFKRGYWLPSDAVLDNKGTWMSNLDIKDYITNIKTKHTLLISDACFSGSIFEYNRDVNTDKSSLVVKKLLTKNGRNAMTSGLDKPVPDQSVFIKYLIKALSENDKSYLKASDLFNTIQEVVLANTDNIPQYGVIKNANHEGGEFIFLKRNE